VPEKGPASRELYKTAAARASRPRSGTSATAQPQVAYSDAFEEVDLGEKQPSVPPLVL